MTDITARILKLADQFFNIPNVSHSTPLQQQGADSLDMVEWIMGLEEEFGIEISDDDAAKITSIQTTIDIVTPLVKP